MKSVIALVGASLVGLALGATTPIPSFTAAEISSGAAMQQLGKIAYDNAMTRLANATSGCTKDTVKIRKEWWVVFYLLE